MRFPSPYFQFAQSLVLIISMIWGAVPAAAAPPCRQALALGIDVSGSVDDQEYRLQLTGLAAALEDPAVRAALVAHPKTPISLSVFEWSGPDYQRILLDWREIHAEADVSEAADTLRRTRRVSAPPATALGQAMVFGARLLARRAACWQQTLDLSGDGISNAGPRPRDVKTLPQVSGLTINGLVVATEDANAGRSDQGEDQLVRYFQEMVAQGPFSFVERADGYETYAETMARKLLRELSGLVISDLGSAHR